MILNNRFGLRWFALSVLLLLSAAGVEAQELSSYAYRTGVDASRWISMTSASDTIFAPGAYHDDDVSSVLPIGFSFLMGNNSYSTFSVSSNGLFRLGAEPCIGTMGAGKFTAAYVGSSLPKISGVARDMSTGRNGYIIYEVHGTAPQRVFACEYALAHTYGSALAADVSWQVQLHEDSNKIVLVYASVPPASTPVAYQTGIASSNTDIRVVNPVTHRDTICSRGYDVEYNAWHGANRYYEFVRPVITCPRPVDVAVRATNDSARLTWHEPGSATSWVVEYAARTFVPGCGNGQRIVSTDTAVWLTGLIPNMQYHVYLHSDCGSDTSSNVYTTFHTACSEITNLPYTENFDNSTGATISPCWVSGSNASTGNYPAISGSRAYSGSQSLFMYAYYYNSEYSYAALPMFRADLSSLMITFRACNSTGSNAHIGHVEVGVMDNPYDISTFQTVRHFTLDNNWSQCTCYLRLYTGTGRYIALRAPGGSTYVDCGAYVDDVVVRTMPACPPPMEVDVTQVTPVSALLHWRESGSATMWMVEYDTVGFQRGRGHTVVASVDSVRLTGLTANTEYDVYIYPSCGVDSVYLHDVFRTECVSSALPFYEDFDSYTASVDIPQCWHVLQGSGNYPMLTNHSGLAFDTAGNSLMTMGNSVVTTPRMPVPANQLLVSFRLRREGESSGSMKVGFVPTLDSMSSFMPVMTITPTDAEYHWYTVDYSSIGSTDTGYVVFKQESTSSLWSYWIDDVSVDTNSGCPTPTALRQMGGTDSSVTIAFNGATSGNIYTIAWGTSTDVAQASATTNTASTTYTINGLSRGVLYNVWVRSQCPGSNSRWTGPLQYCPGSYTMMYGTDTLTTCMATIYDNGGLSANYAANSSDVLVVYPMPGNAVRVTGNSSTELNYDFLDIYDGTGVAGTRFCHISGENQTVGPYTSTTGPLTIRFTSDSRTQYSGYALTVQCVPVSSCPLPRNLSVDSVTNTSIMISFTDTTGVGDYTVKWGTDSRVEHATGSANITTTRYTIGQLTPATTYHVWVRANCATESSAWNAYPSINTLCGLAYATPAVPYREGFETDGLPMCWTEEYMSGNASWQLGSPSVSQGSVVTPHGGRQSLIFNGNNGSVTRLISPLIDVSTLASPQLSFWHTQEAWGNDQDVLSVYYRPTQNHRWSLLATYTNNIRTWTQELVTLPTGLNTCQIAFVAEDNYGYGVMLDDVSLANAVSPCPPPSNFSAVPAGTVALLSWSGTGNFDISYKKYSDTAWSSSLFVSDTHYLLTGLAPETPYNVRVRTDCSDNHSDWQYAVFITLQSHADSLLLPCRKPEAVRLDSNGIGWAHVSWDAGEDASSWMVQLRGGRVMDTLVHRPDVWLNGLSSQTSYTVTVYTVCDSERFSRISDTLHFTTDSGNVDGIAAHIDMDARVSVYPNPATQGCFDIAFGSVSGPVVVTLSDAMGRKISEYEMVIAAYSKRRIDIGSLQDGLYFVSIKSRDLNHVSKLLIRNR